MVFRLIHGPKPARNLSRTPVAIGQQHAAAAQFDHARGIDHASGKSLDRAGAAMIMNERSFH
jgi:hypothetical protein